MSYGINFSAIVIEAQLPGTDGFPDQSGLKISGPELSGIFLASEGIPADLPGIWSQFRGPNSDNIVTGGPPLANAWGAEGPEIVWQLPVGDGYAAPAIFNGTVYLMDYDLEGRADALRALSLADGKEIWRRSYEIKIKRNHGMSRTIPAVTEKYIVTMGPKCHVVCLDTATGDFRWGIDLQRDYGTKEPLWYAGQCPPIVDGAVIIAPAGTDVLMMAIDCETGDTLWECPNPREWKMSHSSIIPMTLLGRNMYVYSAIGGVAGVAADGPDAGKLLWDVSWEAKVVAPSPVIAGEDKIYVTAGYSTGAMMLQLAEAGDGSYDVTILRRTGPEEGLACEQQTPIFHDGLLYSIMPKDAGPMKQQFVCYDTEGNLVWSSGNDNRFGLGPFLLADNKFYLLDDDGTLTMIDAVDRAYKQLGQAQVLHGHDAWGPIAIAGDYMLLRDMNNLVCVDVGA
ncbi:MAG: PQQ-like beta-propeller repeat protein [Candidatus Hydrogenedentes bacterium]|nr:PQQ-like beta-propeller repeat protein [Candidatus Hydrogenedentota bacterium]